MSLRLLVLVPVGLLLALACAGPVSPDPAPEPVPAPTDGTHPDDDEPNAKRPRGKAVEALTATSGSDVDAVLDGDRQTAWRPEGKPDLEGVLLRLEAPEKVSAITVVGCDERMPYVFVDGNAVNVSPTEGGEMRVSLPKGSTLRSVYVRLSPYEGACIRELALFDPSDAEILLSPPRRVQGRIDATSTLAPEVPYRAAYLFDQRTHFGWVEGSKGDGVGESVSVKFARPHSVEAIDLWNGYQRSDDHFAKNNRVASLSISVDDGKPIKINVKDVQGRQRLDIRPTLRGERFKIEIASVKRGTKYDDTVISELRFVDQRGPFTVDSRAMDRATDKLRTELAGSPLAKVIDVAYESFCPSAGTLRIRADGSVVWYGTAQTRSDDEASETATEVIDGAWAVSKNEGPWAQIGLYARHHKVEQRFVPYGQGDERTETTKIVGGNLDIALAADLSTVELDAAVAALAKGPAAERVACIQRNGQLVKKGAIFVRGTAITDVLVPR